MSDTGAKKRDDDGVGDATGLSEFMTSQLSLCFSKEQLPFIELDVRSEIVQNAEKFL